MRNSTSRIKILLFALLFLATGLSAQRPMDKLDRSVVAQKITGGIYVNWRISADEWYNTTYRLYRDGTKIFETTATGASNYVDPSGTIISKYTVSKVKNGIESAPSAPGVFITNGYLEIPVRDIKSLGKQGYYLNDATAADLDGDGQYEIIVKRMKRDWSATCPDFTYFEAYKLDGTFMWAIDVGPNITMDVEINIAAYDFDGDGKAEVFMRSSDNTIFGLDKNNQNGTSVGDRDGDGYTNYRQAPFNGIGGDGFMNAGPEYLSLIDGVTGKELDWANFIARGKSGDWGDDYGHRANKFFFGAPYLDGKHPSLFVGRGIYTMTKMQTYDVVNKKMVPRWNWEVTSSGQLFQGKYDLYPKVYFAQGYHNYTIADVDGDGCDEVNWGSMTIDHDGKPLYSTELGHGDAQHYGDFDPYRKGEEVFACNEANPGTNLRDAKTGQILYRKVASSDVGRACAGNISDAYKGAEVWGGGVGLSATDKVEMSSFGVAENYAVYWDGDLLQELCDHSGFSSSTGVGFGQITKFNGYGSVTPLLTADAYSCNYSKGTPCLQADLIGDWREEEVWWRTDSLALRIYSTPYPTTNRIYTLMHDPQYRQAICWQMCGYNQPPHTSFYLGSDFPTPIPPKCTNGKLVWKGTTSNWDNTSSNFIDGDDAVRIIAGTSTATSFSDGKSVLFDTHSTTRNVNLVGTLSPELLSVSGVYNYTIGGTGSLAGAMHLDKMGDSTLVMNGTHSYTGSTDIWEGNMWINGTLSASPVIVRRHANFGGKVTLGNNLTTEYNAGVYPGGNMVADTMTVNGNFNFVAGAKLIFDLSDNPNVQTTTGKVGGSSAKNDFLYINGTLQIGSGAILLINEVADSISVGKYLLGKVNAITGTLSTVKIQGASGKSVELSYDAVTKNLYLVVKGTRAAGNVVWSGKVDANWNIAKTANWSNLGFADIFVSNDSVYFDATGLNKTITVADSIPASYMEVNSNAAYTFNGTGALTGAMDLYKTNTGTLTINNRNNYSGKTIVDRGTLVMKYAPTATNNGGIGTPIADPAFFVVKDSAIVQVSTANEMSTRGMTMAGSAGGLMNVAANLYWNGAIAGTKLTKFGAGTLFIGNNNTGLTETVLKTGTLKLNSNEAVPYGVGKKITLMGGTLETLNSIGSYLTSSHTIDVPAGSVATVIAGSRCEYNGALTGAGTLNWSCDYIRAYLNGNWSAFTGILNITANGANSTYENHFIVNNGNGFPNATVNIGTGVLMCYKNGTSDNGTTTIKVGMLNGAGTFYNAGLEVGAKGVSGSFSGIISGASSVNKVGAGIWTLSGANTYTGSTTVTAGTLTLTGSLASGSLTVANGANLNLYGSTTGALIISTGGTASVTGTVAGSLVNSGTLNGTGTIVGTASLSNNSTTIPGNTSIGTLTFGGNVTMNTTATLSMQVSGGSSNCDKLAVTGKFTCNGSLNVTMLSGLQAIGDTYQLISAGSISGAFVTVNLPVLVQGLEWDTTALYTTGIIQIKAATGFNIPGIKTGVKQNPTTGIFRIYTEYPMDNLNVLVSTMQGKLISKTIISGKSEFEVDLTGQPDGVYMLRVISDNDTSKMLKLIKQ
ncbi:MAG: autotransporter-associated beta strand repeat-containing protein [Paludibacter sp.]|nr:autotransporter-associated beta strand repeat-containing protein [Paludibacter sp.]